jgi:anionic cell wall polymer biosynthesis LytR-Cps2A-Psr (LCP) family protein
VDDLGFVEAIDRLGEGVVVRVADTADRGLEARFGKALGVADRDVLDAPDALLFVKWRSAPD